MKLFFLSAMFISTFNLCSNNNIKMQQEEVYFFKDINGYKSYISLKQVKDSIYGIFLGMELNDKGIPVYYKSDFKTHIVESNENVISFLLTDFDYSFQPFSFNNINQHLLKGGSDIPFIIQRPIKFFGEHNKDSLILNRISDLYDSKSDKMVFYREKN